MRRAFFIEGPLACCKRSEEHTSELQSQSNLVCRLLLEKKNHQPRRATEQPAYARPADGSLDGPGHVLHAHSVRRRSGASHADGVVELRADHLLNRVAHT